MDDFNEEKPLADADLRRIVAGPGVAGTTIGMLALSAAAIPYVSLFAWLLGLVGFGVGLVGAALDDGRRLAGYAALAVSTVATLVSIIATITFMSSPIGR